MTQVYVQLFSQQEAKILDEYKQQYHVEIDVFSKNYELDVVETILERIDETQKIYVFRNILLGKINESFENLFDDINFSKHAGIESKLTDSVFKNQLLLEKHISITLISTYFCKSICEHKINECVLGAFSDPEVRKEIINPSAKLYPLKNASLEIQKLNEIKKTKLNDALLEVHHGEFLVKNEVKDAVKNIQLQLNEIIAFFVIMSILKLVQVDVLKTEQQVNKMVLFYKDFFDVHLNWIYEKIKLCHKIANVGHRCKELSFTKNLQSEIWAKQNAELSKVKDHLLQRKKIFRSIKNIFIKLSQKHGVQLENDNEKKYLDELCSLHMFLLAKKSIRLINQRIELENFCDSYYSNVVSLIFEDTKLQKDDGFSQSIEAISSRLNNLKSRENSTDIEIKAVSKDLHTLVNQLFEEIRKQAASLKLLNPSSNVERQQQKYLSTLLDKMCLELYRSLK